MSQLRGLGCVGQDKGGTEQPSTSVDPGGNRAEGNVQRGRDLGVTQLLPGEQQQYVSVTNCEFQKGAGDPGCQPCRVDPGVCGLEPIRGEAGLSIDTGVGAKLPALPPPGRIHKVRRNPVQPWGGAVVNRDEARPASERTGKRLGREIFGHRWSEPTDEEGMYRVDMAIKDLTEELGIGERLSDQLGVG